jgi:Ser/Thr protein kinase RdoA (MazF antagonist)
MSYTNLDPFNHGTTTVTYDDVPAEEAENLKEIVGQWGIIADSVQWLSAGAEKASNNFRVDGDKGSFLLKRSHVGDGVKQGIIHSVLDYLVEEGLPVTAPLKMRDDSTFCVQGDSIYVVYDFIDGEHFDGSRYELGMVGYELARIHKGMAEMPYVDDVRRISTPLISHNLTLLEDIFSKVTPGTEFDNYVLSVRDEVLDASRRVAEVDFSGLPMQIIHYDLHPHNLLFRKINPDLEAFFDFDIMRYSQRIRDVAFAMHRFARTFGSQTERQQDVNVDVRDRAELFVNSYTSVEELTDNERKAIPLAVQDEALVRVGIILDGHYNKGRDTWTFDLEKQIETMREGSWFEF